MKGSKKIGLGAVLAKRKIVAHTAIVACGWAHRRFSILSDSAPAAIWAKRVARLRTKSRLTSAIAMPYFKATYQL